MGSFSWRVSVYLWTLAAALMALPTASPAQSAKSSAAAVGEKEPLPGLISSPPLLSGNRRWQMFCKNPRRGAESVTWSPDSRWLALASGRLVRMYDMSEAPPQLKRVLVGHDDAVRAVRFSPNGEWIATCSLDGTARIWNLNGAVQHVYRDHEDAVHDVAWHPDGKLLATASRDGTVRIWSATGETAVVLSAHEAPVNAVSWSPDGKWLASGCDNKTIRYWTSDGKPGPVIEAHIGPVRGLAWNFNGTQLLSCDHGIESSSEEIDDLAHIKIWDAEGKLVSALQVDKPLSHVCWNPEGTLAVGAGARMVWVWPGQVEKPFNRFFTTGVNVPVAWRPNGETIAAGPQLHIPDGQQLQGLISIRAILLNSLSQDPTGTQIRAARLNPASFILFDSDGKELQLPEKVRDTGVVQVMVWSPDGKTFVPRLQSTAEFQRYDLEGNKVGEVVPQTIFMASADWSRDGRYVAGGGSQRIVQLIDLQTGTVAQIGRQAHGITQVRFTPDQQQVCSAGYDGCVRFWSLDGKAGQVYEAISAPIRGLSWSPDGQVLATGHEDHTIRLWNTAGETEVVMGDHGDFVETLDFSPDGSQLASGSWDSSVRIWNRDGSAAKVLRGHEGNVMWVQWTRDGQGVLSSSDDGSIRRWNAATGITEWQTLFGEAGGHVTIDAQGRVKHGDEKILESDFVAFAEDEKGNLVQTEWAEIRAQALAPANPSAN